MTAVLPNVALASMALCGSLLTFSHARELSVATLLVSVAVLPHIALQKSIKVLAVLALGLGAIAGYAALPRESMKHYSKAFTMYVNVAVFANVMMMAFVPSGGTIRGRVHPWLCLTLTAWLCLQARQVEWDTVRMRNRIFVYTASPLAWILHHALYRVCMISLPCFATQNYLVLEPVSLGLMFYLHWKTGLPCAQVFGYADTLATASAATVSVLFADESSGGVAALLGVSEAQADCVIVPLQLAVLCSAATLGYQALCKENVRLSE